MPIFADMKKTYLFFIIACAVLCTAPSSCTNDDNESNPTISEGSLTSAFVKTLDGFGEEKTALLEANGVTNQEFIRLSTDSAWALPHAEQKKLKSVRDGVSRPDGKTLLQKIIPLEDISTYMNNVYGGTIGGFVCEAADVKSLHTMEQVFHGLRLDYSGTKFKADGAGYAVIRFYSSATENMYIPYSPELGGSQPHEWPNGGGGFTTSTLGEGGYPEWTFSGYYAPEENAELYEVTPEGREILRSIYHDGRWQTYESPYLPSTTTRSSNKAIRNGRYSEGLIQTLCDYHGFTFHLRGETEGRYGLSTDKPLPVEGLKLIERGVYGISVPCSEISNIREVVFSK